MTCVHGQSVSAAAGYLELLQLLPGVRGLEQLAERQEGQISWMIARHLKKNYFRYVTQYDSFFCTYIMFIYYK